MIKSWKFYILFILIPSVLFFFLFFNGVFTIYKKENKEQVRKEKAHQATAILTYYLQNEHYIEEIARKLQEFTKKNDIDRVFQKAKNRLNYVIDLFIFDKNGIITHSTDSRGLGFNVTKTKYYDFIADYNSTFTSLREVKNKFHQNVVTTPIYDNNDNIRSYLTVTFNIEKIIKEELAIENELSKTLLVNKFNQPILGNTKLLNNKDKDTYTYDLLNNKWKIYYTLPKVPKEKLAIALLISFGLSFLLFHLIFTFLVVKEYKQLEIVKRLNFLEQFAAGVAHEIKNPITAIKGFTDMIQENEGQGNKMYFDIIRKEINKINQISSEFLVLGKPVLVDNKTFVIQECIQNTIEVLKSEATKKKINFVTNLETSPLYFTGDEKHINQVVLNIGKNAIEASNHGDTITINLHTSNFKLGKEKSLLIDIEDQGCGIKTEDLDKLFVPFHTTKESGSGLGMSICKKIIEAYNGEIKVTSGKEKGTKVRVLLPITNKVLKQHLNE